MEAIHLVLIAIALSGISLIFLIRGISISNSTFEWKPTKGTVAIDNIDEFRGRIRVTGKQLTYAYEVEGKQYVSNRVYAPIADNLFTYIVHLNNSKFAENNYQNGQVVTVFYNPQKPWKACLKQGGAKYVIQEFSVWMLVFIVMFTLVTMA